MITHIGKLSLASATALMLIAGGLTPTAPARAVDVAVENQRTVTSDETDQFSPVDDVVESNEPTSLTPPADIEFGTQPALPLAGTNATGGGGEPTPPSVPFGPGPGEAYYSAPLVTAQPGEFGGFLLTPTASLSDPEDIPQSWLHQITDVTNGYYHNQWFSDLESQFYDRAQPGRTYMIASYFTSVFGRKSAVGYGTVTMPGEIGPDPLFPIGNAIVSGQVKVGQTLTAKSSLGVWELTYQWLRNGTPITGATSRTYVIAPSDAGKSLSVAITSQPVPGYSQSSSTSATHQVPLATLAAPTPQWTTQSSRTQVGKTLQVATGSWTPGTTLTYRWLRDGKTIAGATKASYKVVPADAGRKLTAQVTGKKTGFATVSKTTSAKPVDLQKLASTTPKISAKKADAKVGKTVKITPGKWTSGTTLSYQWLRNGKAIQGATKASYKLTKNDKNRQISVKVTGKKPGYAAVSKTSNKTASIS